MCFVLACRFVMTTGAAIDRDRHFENLHSSSLEPFFFFLKILNIQIKASKFCFVGFFSPCFLKASLSNYP